MSSALTIHDSPSALLAPRAQRVVLGLHRALDFADLWTSLQRLFEALVPHDTLVMSVNYLDWRKESTTRRLTSANSRVIEDASSSRLVVEEGRNFFQPFLEQNPGIPCYHHTQVMPGEPEKIPTTGYYQRYMLPLGWRYSAHLLFWRGTEVETAFALRRRADQGDFTVEEMEVLRTLHPHISVALERVRAFEGERRRRRLLENFYRAKPEAVLFLDWDLSVLYASQEALTLSAAWNLGADHARLFTPQAVFSLPPEIIEACTKLKPQWEQPAPVDRTHEPLPLTVQIAGTRSGYDAEITLRRESGGALTKPLFVIRLNGPGAVLPAAGASGSAHERLRGGLTPAERELAALVCTGLSNKEIAAKLKRSEGSVKVQLSGVFQKLRVNSRAKLMVALRGP